MRTAFPPDWFLKKSTDPNWRRWKSVLDSLYPIRHHGYLKKLVTDLNEIFRSVCTRYHNVYNFSYQNCQEIALCMAAEATKDDVFLGFNLSNFKGLLLVLSTYAIALVPLFCMCVEIDIRFK